MKRVQRGDATRESAEKAIESERDEAETKAYDALRRYKFQMFGYWAAIWVHMNRLCATRKPNPFRELVSTARSRTPSPSSSVFLCVQSSSEAR